MRAATIQRPGRPSRAGVSEAAAFTLVELLVVIGIITLLIGIVLPVMGRAREQARAVQCASNISQIYKACVMYANDNRGVLPMPTANLDRDLTPSQLEFAGIRFEEWGWLNYREGALWPYLSSSPNVREQLFLCPADLEPRFARKYMFSVPDPSRPRNSVTISQPTCMVDCA
jgi:type II secretory pathway pseudopilin PulG